MATTMPTGISAIGITAIGMPGAGIRATGPVTLARSPLWWLRINSLEIKAVKSLQIVGALIDASAISLLLFDNRPRGGRAKSNSKSASSIARVPKREGDV